MLTSFEQSKYAGHFVNGKMNGYGHLEDEFAKSDYTGCFLNNKKEGFGKMSEKTGVAGDYEGYFHNNMKNGVGKKIYGNRSIYEGGFKNDK